MVERGYLRPKKVLVPVPDWLVFNFAAQKCGVRAFSAFKPCLHPGKISYINDYPEFRKQKFIFQTVYRLPSRNRSLSLLVLE